MALIKIDLLALDLERTSALEHPVMSNGHSRRQRARLIR
jgi:hypothetical protein